MKRRTVLRPRKEPQQERSRQMREDILTASIRVLQRDGALKFTTPRVAEAAGISVGSLYQYFPNKQALLFALHSRTVDAAWTDVQRILDHDRWSAREKVRRIARLFFLSEAQETAEMGSALQDAEMFFAEQPEHVAMNARVLRRFTRFVRETLPPSTTASRVKFGARLLVTVLESVGRAVAGQKLTRRAVDQWARECTEMVSDHLGFP